jgi:hypothetical protein
MDLATYTTAAKGQKTARKVGRPRKVGPRMDGQTTITTIKIYETLKQALVPAGEKLFTYKEGFDDAKIAKDFGVVEKTVTRHRVKLFGKLKFETEFIPYGVLLQRYNDLEKRLAYLETQLGVTSSK